MLKNVVLPAPLGPIRLTIERSGMSKSTELTATSPPKTLVIPRASMMLAGFSSLIDVPPERVADVATFAAAELFGALAVGDYAFGPEQHHQDQDNPEQKEVVLRYVRLAQEGAAEGVAEGVHPLVYLRQQVEVQALQKHGTEDDAVDVAHPPEDDHAQHDDRDVERERVGKDVLYECDVEGAGQAAEHGPEGVCPQLRRHGVYAHG